MTYKRNQFKRLKEIEGFEFPLYDLILVKKIKAKKGSKIDFLEVVGITFQENEEIPIFTDKIASKCELIEIKQTENHKVCFWNDKNYTQFFINDAEYKFKIHTDYKACMRKVITLEVIKDGKFQ